MDDGPNLSSGRPRTPAGPGHRWRDESPTRGRPARPVRPGVSRSTMSAMTTPTMVQRLGAEFLGTFWLVFGGCGAAIYSATFLSPVAGGAVQLGIGFLGVALAFGLTVVTMAYAVGHISGAHFNPAITIGVAVAKRFEWKDVPAYVVTQVAGGLLAGSGSVRHRQRTPRLRRPPATWRPTATASTRPAGTACSPCSSPRCCSPRSSSTSSSVPPTPGRRRASPRSPSVWCSPSSTSSRSRSPTPRSTRPGPPVSRSSTATARSVSCGCSGWRRSSVPPSPARPST